jgi:hypothetical protein
MPLTAIDFPLPKALPPEDVTVLISCAVMVADSSAFMVISPVAWMVAYLMYESTELRRSFLTTIPPKACESEPVTLPMFGMASDALVRSTRTHLSLFEKSSFDKSMVSPVPLYRYIGESQLIDSRYDYSSYTKPDDLIKGKRVRLADDIWGGKTRRYLRVYRGRYY